MQNKQGSKYCNCLGGVDRILAAACDLEMRAQFLCKNMINTRFELTKIRFPYRNDI
jgi:hypothetical protein